MHSNISEMHLSSTNYDMKDIFLYFIFAKSLITFLNLILFRISASIVNKQSDSSLFWNTTCVFEIITLLQERPP